MAAHYCACIHTYITLGNISYTVATWRHRTNWYIWNIAMHYISCIISHCLLVKSILLLLNKTFRKCMFYWLSQLFLCSHWVRQHCMFTTSSQTAPIHVLASLASLGTSTHWISPTSPVEQLSTGNHTHCRQKPQSIGHCKYNHHGQHHSDTHLWGFIECERVTNLKVQGLTFVPLTEKPKGWNGQQNFNLTNCHN